VPKSKAAYLKVSISSCML